MFVFFFEVARRYVWLRDKIDKKTAEMLKRTICDYGFKSVMITQSARYDRLGSRVNGIKRRSALTLISGSKQLIS